MATLTGLLLLAQPVQAEEIMYLVTSYNAHQEGPTSNRFEAWLYNADSSTFTPPTSTSTQQQFYQNRKRYMDYADSVGLINGDASVNNFNPTYAPFTAHFSDGNFAYFNLYGSHRDEYAGSVSTKYKTFSCFTDDNRVIWDSANDVVNGGAAGSTGSSSTCYTRARYYCFPHKKSK
ncbi:hypothetical protein HDU76_006089 [Blyttiomyces sp. JEL0837]|nr:hypothetical protein HDU76_006089 [Blyttiomyces sp. JEL0837]